jgi:hypothetical protein
LRASTCRLLHSSDIFEKLILTKLVNKYLDLHGTRIECRAHSSPTTGNMNQIMSSFPIIL